MAIAINFDTLEIAKELEKVGFSQQQAEAITKIQQQILTDNLDDTIATKADIVRLENSCEIRFSKIENELVLIKYMLGIIIGILITLTMKFVFA